MAAVAAGASPAATTAQPTSIVTRLGVSTTEFSCDTNGVGDCHYLVLHSLCQEKFEAPGRKLRTCTYTEATPPFRIRSGERRTVTNLASDFLYTMKVGSAPTVDEVLRAPTPH